MNLPKSTYLLVLEKILLFGSVYLVGEAIVHLFGIKLIELPLGWSPHAINYVDSYMKLWGCGALFFAFMLNHARKFHQTHGYVLKYLSLAGAALAIVLVYMSFVVSNDRVSLNLWLPYYPHFVRLEALLLVSFCLYVWYGFKQKYLHPQ